MRTFAFLGGLGMTIREGFLHGPERPSLLAAWVGMMAASIGWGKGERFLRNDDDENED